MTALFTPAERVFAQLIARLLLTNPFDPERVAIERALLGPDYLEGGLVWSYRANVTTHNENVRRIGVLLTALLERVRARFGAALRASDADLVLYVDISLYDLYDRHDLRFQPFVEGAGGPVGFYEDFEKAYTLAFSFVSEALLRPKVGHLFAVFFQIRRAFHHIYTNLLGGSLPAALLRAATWRAIFSRDLQLYADTFFLTQDAISLLITGPTGSGKELVAAAVGGSRYRAFDTEKKTFAGESYHAFNLSEVAPALVESELFGYVRGAFTGAVADKPGLFAQSRPGGTAFLDEVGELTLDVQAKLLRVFQTRKYRPVGGVELQALSGKLVTATHRDLPAMIEAREYRLDFYHRISGDRVVTPSLRAQLDDAPGERRELARFFAAKLIGSRRAEALADELDASFDRTLGPRHPWEGNMREMEQRVGLLLMQGDAQPDADARGGAGEDFGLPFVQGKMTAAQAERRYATIVFAEQGSYVDAAAVLGVDRRTVSGMIDQELLARLKKRRPEP